MARSYVTKICGYCNSSFSILEIDAKRGRGTFCSLSCSCSHRNKKSAAPKTEFCCTTCNKKFMLPLGKVNDGRGKFCSVECSYKNPDLKSDPTEVFLSNIIYPENVNDCWLYKRLETRGYGVVCINGKQTKAHRFSYEHFVGPIPRGMMICHRCDNSKCVNWRHLYPGTAKDNARDMIERGRTKHIGQGYWKGRKTTRD